MKVVYYPLNNCFILTSWCVSSSCREAPSAKSLCLLCIGKDIKLEIEVLQVVHLTVAGWWRIMWLTAVGAN